MIADLRVRVLDAKTGLSLVRGDFDVLTCELLEGSVISITAQSEDGRRASVQISAKVLEDVADPASAAGPSELEALRDRAATIHYSSDAPRSRFAPSAQ